MFMRKKAKPATDSNRSDGRNEQQGASGGEGSNFVQRGNPLPSHHGGNPPPSSHGPNSLSRHHEGNPIPGSLGGNPTPGSFGGNPFPSSLGGNSLSSRHGGNSFFPNQDRGSNFDTQREGSTYALDYQHGHNASRYPSRGANAPYRDPVGGINPRYLDSNRGMQPQRGSDVRPYVNPEREQSNIDLEKTALGILDQVLANNPKLQDQKNPSCFNERDAHSYGGGSQSFPRMGNPEYPPHYKVPDLWHNRQGPPTLNMNNMDNSMHPSGMHPPGMHPPGMYPPGMHPQGMHPPGMHPPGMYPPGMHPPGMYPPGMYPPGMGGGMDQMSRKRTMPFAGPPENRKTMGFDTSRLGPPFNVPGGLPGHEPFDNRMFMNHGPMGPSSHLEEIVRRGLNITPADVKGLSTKELKIVASRIYDFPKEALRCKVCRLSKFTALGDYFSHGVGKKHEERLQSLYDVILSTESCLEAECQLAYGRYMSHTWDPLKEKMCRLCKVPNKHMKGFHVSLKECTAYHQYARTIKCCDGEKHPSRLALEYHQLSLEHLRNEYLQMKKRQERDEKEREKLNELKELFKTSARLTADRKFVRMKFNKPALNTEKFVYELFGEKEVPQEVVSLLEAREIKEETPLIQGDARKTNSHYEHYKPSVPQWPNMVMFVTDVNCLVCGTTLGTSKQEIIDHCSTREHYDNIVKKQDRLKKTSEEVTKGEKENKEEEKEKEGMVEQSHGKSKWTRGEEAKEDGDDDDDDIHEDPYEGSNLLNEDGNGEEDDGEQEIGDEDADEYYCEDDDDDVRMEDLKDEVKEVANESDEPSGKKAVPSGEAGPSIGPQPPAPTTPRTPVGPPLGAPKCPACGWREHAGQCPQCWECGRTGHIRPQCPTLRGSFRSEGGADKGKDEVSIPVNPEKDSTTTSEGEEKQGAKSGITLRKKKSMYNF